MQPNSDQRGLQVPSSRGNITPPSHRQAAADLMRDQIDKIYEEPQPNEQTVSDPAGQPVQQTQTNPYQQTHDDSADIQAAEQNAAVQQHWQKYHSAWQQYYQMYYERYYQAQVDQHNATTSAAKNDEPETLTKSQATNELRNELLEKVKVQTTKIRRSRHFLPAIISLSVAGIIVLLQYNQLALAWLYSFTTPAALETSNSFLDPNTDVNVGPNPTITIPKLGVEAPVVYDLTTLDEPVVQTKLQSGVVHYPIPGANAVPGQMGNTVILGHSANDVFAAGEYKFIFLRLDQLQNGDQFYLNYEGKRYTYVVNEKKVISPNQVSTLVLPNTKPVATLVTCVPVGTSTNRLLVFADQVAPDPTKATVQQPQDNTQTNTQQIGGGTKSFFERLFSN